MKAKTAKPTGLLPINTFANETPWLRRAADIEPLFGLTPFNMMRRFTDDFERMFDNFNAFNLMPRFETDFAFPRMAELEKAAWWPEIEVTEKNGELRVHADLPGMKKEDVNVEFLDNALVISGERKLETKEEKEGYFRTERNYGNFYRSIPLPEGFDADKAHAAFHDGVLEVTVAIPKIAPKARKLEITEKATKAHAKGA